MTAGEFLLACSAFARRHPAAVLEMAAPELAVDHRAPAHHVHTTVLQARKRMLTTAKLTLRTAAIAAGGPTDPDLFTTPERLTA
ncbi:hypothetical protein E3C22_16495 [Jiella endophytica]|uniref:Uncharacterized protein n=1 Tax=Jiella endophytica TaxID=2558362 RepID=A0A4Y8RF91_9HYPH|nr:hypothetical protein [Jiella endophytica]TFF20508.1 hypothetical protein E3C22_16495 [Jiella endophytica]